MLLVFVKRWVITKNIGQLPVFITIFVTVLLPVAYISKGHVFKNTTAKRRRMKKGGFLRASLILGL